MIYIAVCDDNEKLAKALRNKICRIVTMYFVYKL